MSASLPTTLHGPDPLCELLWQFHWSPLLANLTATWTLVSLCNHRNETIWFGDPLGTPSLPISAGNACRGISCVAMTSCSQIVRVPSWSTTARYWPTSLKRMWSIGTFSGATGCATGSRRMDFLERTSSEGRVTKSRGETPWISPGKLEVDRMSAMGGAKAIVPWADQLRSLLG